MNKKIKIILISFLIVCMLVNTGCDIPFLSSEKEKPAPPRTGVDNSSATADDDYRIQTLIKEYYNNMFQKGIEEYNESNSSGAVPEVLQKFLAKRTINEGNKNPEVGLTYPRYVDINGLTILSYVPGRDQKMIHSIEATYLGQKNNVYLYFVKIDFKAKGYPVEEFNKAFSFNEKKNIYEKTANVNVDEGKTDLIRVRQKFDVQVVKEENGEVKILTAKETLSKQKSKFRVLKYNNEFLIRIPYLDPTNLEDKKIIDAESKVIREFFDKLLMLDRERMNLMKKNWGENVDSFKDFLSKLTIDKSKDNKESIALGPDYKQKFDIQYFPLKQNMERIKSYNDFQILAHPSYSEKNKMYIVKFVAPIEISGAAIGLEKVYKYDYYVTMALGNDAKINSIYQNEMIRLQSK